MSRTNHYGILTHDASNNNILVQVSTRLKYFVSSIQQELLKVLFFFLQISRITAPLVRWMDWLLCQREFLSLFVDEVGIVAGSVGPA